MPEFVTVAKIGEIAPGYIKEVEVHGHKMALCNADGKFFAVDILCAHEQKPMGEGELEGESIICPWHGSQFDLNTGVLESGPASGSIRTYEVLVNGDEIKIAEP